MSISIMGFKVMLKGMDFAAEEWVASQDWTGKEEPCAVQVALEQIRKGRK